MIRFDLHRNITHLYEEYVVDLIDTYPILLCICIKIAIVAIVLALTQMVMAATTSTMKMMIALSLTCWADPNLDS